MLTSFEDVRNYFMDYWNRWIKHQGYGQACATRALKKYEEIYERKLASIPEKQQFSYACEILNIAMQMEIIDDFVDALCQAVCEFIPFSKLSAENKKLISDIYRYQREVLQKKIEGRLLLFVIAIKCNKVIGRSSIGATIDSILSVSVDTGAKLNGIEDGKVEDYFEWAFDSISKFSLKADDLSGIHKLFQFSKRTQTLFMEYWCKVTYKNSKGDKDYSDFGEFLSFMFGVGSFDDQEMVGKYLCKLNKQKLEDLDEEMKTYFRRDRKATHAWENIREIASSTNPLLNNLSNLFKRK